MEKKVIQRITAILLVIGLILTGCGGSGAASADAEQGRTEAEAQNSQAAETEDSRTADTEDNRAMAPANQTQKAENALIRMEAENLPRAAREYTVLIYMVGSNLETNRGAATSDLEEMLASGIDFTGRNIIVYTGGARKWSSNIPCDRNCLLDLSKGSGSWLAGMTDGSSDMGAPETLTEFLNTAVENYPARHYCLIFWDHGSGPISGFGVDELFGNDSLQFGELRQAMDASPFGPGGSARLDWVGFDACLMGSLEHASLWKDYTDYMVASEELEPADGWDYSFLQTLNGTSDPVKIMEAAVNAYYDWYTSGTGNKVTLAAYDLSRAGAVAEAYAGLAARMAEDLDDGAYARIVQIRQKVLQFGTSEVTVRGSGTDLLDLTDIAEGFSSSYSEETKAVQEAVREMVLINRTNIDGAAGLSVYFPGENRKLYEEAGGYFGDSVSVSDDVKSFYDSYTEKWNQTSDTDWTLGEFSVKGDEILLQLTPDQTAGLAEARYTVLHPLIEGQYYLDMVRVQAEVDDAGWVHIPADPELICMEDGGGRVSPLGFFQTSTNQGLATYRSFNTLLSPAQEFWSLDPVVDQQAAIIAELEDGQVRVQSVQAVDSTASGKNTLNMEDYSRLLYVFGYSYFPVRNEDGTMKSFTDWYGQGSAVGLHPFDLPEDRSIPLEIRHVSEIYAEEPLVLQLELFDVNGRIHATETCPLAGAAGPQQPDTVTLEDGQGTWTFTRTGDQAVLTDYEGIAEILTVPDRVRGLPVTGIGKGAVYSDSAKEIILPATLKTIEKNAIRCPGLQTVSLPAGIEKASSCIFGECKALEQITVDGNPNGQGKGIRAIDGVLFNGDGTVLLSYPMCHGISYAVPEGTRTIAYAAFVCSAADPEKQLLETVAMPETLKRIESCAFFGCSRLSGIELPESLEYIGSRAFGSTEESGEERFQDKGLVPVDSVYIGKNVRYIGKNAFDGLNLRRFRVSDQNSRYSAVDGMLAVRSGDTIVEVPRGMDGLVCIPEGVVGLENYIFCMFCQETEFYLPDSLTRIPADAFPYVLSEEQNEDGEYDRVYRILFHCSEGSAAADYADQYGIARDTEQAEQDMLRSMEYSMTTLSTAGGEMDFQVYADHAVLVSCRGRGSVLDIPASAGGQPVTEIGDGRNSIAAARDVTDKAPAQGLSAQEESGKITSLRLPDTVTAIKAEALDDPCFSIEELELPASLEYFDPEAMGKDSRECAIGSFKMEGGSHYRTENGVLYTADGSTLVSCPPAYDFANRLTEAGTAENGDTIYSFKAAPGTETIGPLAFADLQLTNACLQVEFPDSLKEIGRRAFYGARLSAIVLPEGTERAGAEAFCMADVREKELILPDSITVIERSAFASIGRSGKEFGDEEDGFSSIHLPASLETIGEQAFAVSGTADTILECGDISLGSKVSSIGDGAFNSVNCKAFEVSRRNKQYASVDGFLLTKDGKALLRAPYGMTGEVTVPEGVISIEKNALWNCPGITDVHIPASVTMISVYAFSKAWDAEAGQYVWKITLHCPAGSAAADYAERLGIPWKKEK